MHVVRYLDKMHFIADPFSCIRLDVGRESAFASDGICRQGGNLKLCPVDKSFRGDEQRSIVDNIARIASVTMK